MIAQAARPAKTTVRRKLRDGLLVAVVSLSVGALCDPLLGAEMRALVRWVWDALS